MSTPFLNKLIGLFKNKAGDGAGSAAAASPTEPQEADGFDAPPPPRRVIQPTVLVEGAQEFQQSDRILIKAELSALRDQLKFMVNRPLFANYSWFFPNFESAAGSPLGEAIFSLDGVETLLVQQSTAIVTRTQAGTMEDWEALARAGGAAIRELLESGQALISEEIVRSIPPEEVIKDEIQKVIDTEVNPGVAGHGGRITLKNIEGNTVTIEMGGGCQGCSAADLTLKQGIHNAFRMAVPSVGAILDETDHASGLNPYFS